MKKKLIRISVFVLTVATILFTASCSGEGENPGGGDSSKDPELSVTPSMQAIVFSADGQSVKSGLNNIEPIFTVKTNQGAWEVSSNKTWLHVENVDKLKNTFSLRADENTSATAPEPAEVIITAGNATPVKIKVTQLSVEHLLTVTPSDRTIIFSADGKTAQSGNNNFTPEFIVTTNVNGWTVESDKTWLIATRMTDNKFKLTAVANSNAYPPDDAQVTVTAGNAPVVVITVKQKNNPNGQSKFKSIVNPYANVNFNSTLKLRAQLHVHTTLSDASPGMTPDVMRNAYYDRQFDIVALTDHEWERVSGSNISNYIYHWVTKNVPKTEYKTYKDKQVLFVQGVEVSEDDFNSQDHFNVFFIPESYRYTPHQGMKIDIGKHIENTDGIIVLNHPWRTVWPNPVEYHTDLLNTYPANRLIGIENGNARDKEIWDGCLTNLAPRRNVYGFSTDDAHHFTLTATSFFGFRWQELLVSENTIPKVKEAMRNGESFSFVNTSGTNDPYIYDPANFPSVKNIIIDKNRMTITVEAEEYSKIEWVSCGKTVPVNDKTLAPDEWNLDKYVRFVLIGSKGTLYSQPFLLVGKD